MIKLIKVLISLAFLLAVSVDAQSEFIFKIVFSRYWSIKWVALLGFSEKNVCYWYGEIAGSQIDPFMCTHIIYSFLGIDGQGGINHLYRSEGQAEGNKKWYLSVKIRLKNYFSTGLIRQITNLRSQNPNLKILAAVGGYNEPMVPLWSSLAANANYRSTFANNIYNFIVKNNLNGIGELTQLLSSLHRVP